MNSKMLLPAAALFFVVASGLGALPPREGQADDTSEQIRPLTLEVFGGFTPIRPVDLNLLADYYNAYPLFFYSAQYNYLHDAYGSRFTYSASRSGDDRLKGIRSGFPCGLRLRYALSRSFSLWLGLEYLKQNRLSGTSIRYQIDDRSYGLIQTDPQEVTAVYPDFFLGVSAWIPQIGARLAEPLGKNWQLGGSLGAGPLLARCRSVVETGYRYQYVNGYWSESHYLLEMKGKGVGWALELNAELRRRLTRRWSLFLAAGYAWRRAGTIEGEGHNQSLALDSNAVQDLVENNWSGRWQKQTALVQRFWGEFSQAYYGNYFNDSEAAENFVLDLSAWQLKAGVAWGF
ncbi:MAG: hypothetical protein NTW95_06740 [Candidatus Aminicenantes bacterium]|nr:hypothetical protein [Candidatus Aminicenantes bacterium]